MYTIGKTYQEKQEIKKSEFICTLVPVSSLDEVNDNLSLIRKKYYDATHNCYAYILGNKGEIVKCSDDGEPSQTAGVVILEALKKNELTNILAVVTRYFGGIKLGAGGLVRAYASSTSLAIQTIEKQKIEDCQELTIEVSYPNYNLIEKYLKEFKETNKSFESIIIINLIIPLSKIDELVSKLIEVTKNDIVLVKGSISSIVL
ncbi:MAG: YigZ family protein [Bacilli bacterium]|nr:YigZ family protein [Bacilli bacterium]